MTNRSNYNGSLFTLNTFISFWTSSSENSEHDHNHVDGLSAYILFGIIYISFLPLLGSGSYTPISAISFI